MIIFLQPRSGIWGMEEEEEEEHGDWDLPSFFAGNFFAIFLLVVWFPIFSLSSLLLGESCVFLVGGEGRKLEMRVSGRGRRCGRYPNQSYLVSLNRTDMILA